MLKTLVCLVLVGLFSGVVSAAPPALAAPFVAVVVQAPCAEGEIGVTLHATQAPDQRYRRYIQDPGQVIRCAKAPAELKLQASQPVLVQFQADDSLLVLNTATRP